MTDKTPRQGRITNIPTIGTVLDFHQLLNQMQVLNNVVQAIKQQFHALSFHQQEVQHMTQLLTSNA